MKNDDGRSMCGQPDDSVVSGCPTLVAVSRMLDGCDACDPENLAAASVLLGWLTPPSSRIEKREMGLLLIGLEFPKQGDQSNFLGIA